MDRLVDAKQPAGVAVEVHGDPIVRLARLGRFEKPRPLTADNRCHGPVCAIRVDDAEITVLVQAEAAGIPPGT